MTTWEKKSKIKHTWTSVWGHVSLLSTHCINNLQKIRVPPKERGHKQLGKPNALWHLLQLNIVFSIGFFTTLEKTASVYHARLLLATYGIAYAFEVDYFPIHPQSLYSLCMSWCRQSGTGLLAISRDFSWMQQQGHSSNQITVRRNAHLMSNASQHNSLFSWKRAQISRTFSMAWRIKLL